MTVDLLVLIFMQYIMCMSILQVLVGPSDWEDYSLGKVGVERYRTHNLPADCACAGLYELGIIANSTDESHKTRQLALSEVLVVYLGQADNVRTRLQQYGRAGSHLDHGCSVTSSGPGLFKEIFSMRYSILYRWAPVSEFYYAYNTLHRLLRKSISIECHYERHEETINKFQKKVFFYSCYRSIFFLLCCIYKHSGKNLLKDLACWHLNFLQKTTMYWINPIIIELATYIMVLSHPYVALGIFLADI